MARILSDKEYDHMSENGWHMITLNGVKMKKLFITYYNRKQNNTWNFNKVYTKEYYFRESKPNEDIKKFVDDLQDYEIIFIHTWEIKKA